MRAYSTLEQSLGSKNPFILGSKQHGDRETILVRKAGGKKVYAVIKKNGKFSCPA